MTPSPTSARRRAAATVLAAALLAALSAGPQAAPAPGEPAPHVAAAPPAPVAAPVPVAAPAPAEASTTQVASPVEPPPAAPAVGTDPAAVAVPAADTRPATATPPADRPRTPSTTPSAVRKPPPPAPEPETVLGTLVRAYAEAGSTQDTPAAEVAEGQPGIVAWIETPDGAVHVDAGQVGHVPDGATVRAVLAPATDTTAARAVLSAEVVALPATTTAGGSPADTGGDLAAGATTTVHEVTVVMVRPADGRRDATTLADVTTAVNGPVASFWSQQTRGTVQLRVTKAVDWISTAAPCSDAAGIWAEAAQASGFVRDDNRHLLVYVSTEPSSLPGCYAGYGTVGSSVSAGGKAYVRGTGTSLIAHELGHNMGLGHSDELQCDRRADDDPGDCTVQTYRDWYDVMGISWSNLGTLTAQHATAVGGMTARDRIDVTGPTQAVLAPMGSLSGVRALRLADGDDTYWVEYRAATGRDAWLADDSNYRDLAAGVLVRRVNPNDQRRSLLLDATPSAATSFGSDWHQVLPVGGTLTVASGQWSVRVDAVSAAGAAVSVVPAGVGRLQASGPVQVLSPADGARLAPGTVTVDGTGTAPEGTLQYEVVGENGPVARGFTNAGANGEPGAFRFSVTLPAGEWTVSVWVADDSDGESGAGPRPGEVRRSFVVG